MRVIERIVWLLVIFGGTASWSIAATPDAEPQRIDLSYVKPIDTRGQTHSLAGGEHPSHTAFVFVSSECPISRQYVPELNRLATGVPKGVKFYGILSDPTVTRAAAAKFTEEFAFEFPVLFDASGELAALFQPAKLPEAFLLDASGNLAYRGRIDDLYADIKKRRAEPTRRDLLEAMTALSEGRAIEVARTDAVGCPFEAGPRDSAKSAEVTYNRDVAPILFAHCAECHRPGEVAPFSLLTYEDASKRAAFLKDITSSRSMPPWKAADGHGDFLDARRLTPREIELIGAWADAGAPEGDAEDLPPQPQFAEGWRLGEPDLVATVPHVTEVPADGPDIFQHYVVPLDHVKDEMLVGFEFRAGNAAVVHHAILFVDTSGRARQRDEQTPEPGWRSSGSVDASTTGMLGVWTPGMTPRFYTNNVGIPLDKGADLVIQLHLHPSGKAESDQSRIGLHFAKAPVEKVMSRNPLLMGTLLIDAPAGESRYRTGSSVVLPADVTLTSVFPHMHMIGKEMKVTATLPDGTVKPLIWINDWNFYWQDAYVYREPVLLPKGTKIEVESIYDNSADNPFNPTSPPKRVLFGNESTDEMCFAIFQTIDFDRDARRAVGRATMQSLLEDWAKAPLDDEARAKITIEAMKLFGNRRGGQRPQPNPEQTPQPG